MNPRTTTFLFIAALLSTSGIMAQQPAQSDVEQPDQPVIFTADAVARTSPEWEISVARNALFQFQTAGEGILRVIGLKKQPALLGSTHYQPAI